ncbi:MAG: DUF1724 domain-containing protein [Methanosarcina barkeri]|nr:DUF1724 domain-containing protein [Methanosarcina sp. ERenArc_MAG2]
MGFIVTDKCLALSLYKKATYTTTTGLFISDPKALEWEKRLFGHCNTRSVNLLLKLLFLMISNHLEIDIYLIVLNIIALSYNFIIQILFSILNYLQEKNRNLLKGISRKRKKEFFQYALQPWN